MTTMQHALQNGVVFIQPPPQQADQMMLHYAHAKIADDSIAALILLPSDHCTHVTDHLVHIDTYPPESHHWRTPPEVPYSLWYDPQGHNDNLAHSLSNTLLAIPKSISPTSVERLNMLFSAQVAGQNCIALLDTGATLSFITERMVRRAGLKLTQTTSTVWGAGNNQISTKGTVTLPLRMGAYKNRIQATVVDGIIPGVELVLGQEFQQATRAIINCGMNMTTLHHPDGRSCSIHPINHTMNTMCILMEQAQQSQGPLDSTVITAKAAAKLLKKGAPYVLLNLYDTTPGTRIAGSEHPSLPPPLLALRHRSDQPGSHLVATMLNPTTDSVEEGQSHPKSYAQHVPPPALQKILDEMKEVFPQDLPYGVPPDRGTGEAIPLTEFNKIPFRRNRRWTPQETQLCTEMVTDLLSKGLVTPSKSPFGAPILFIPKKKGGYRG